MERIKRVRALVRAVARAEQAGEQAGRRGRIGNAREYVRTHLLAPMDAGRALPLLGAIQVLEEAYCDGYARGVSASHIQGRMEA